MEQFDLFDVAEGPVPWSERHMFEEMRVVIIDRCPFPAWLLQERDLEWFGSDLFRYLEDSSSLSISAIRVLNEPPFNVGKLNLGAMSSYLDLQMEAYGFNNTKINCITLWSDQLFARSILISTFLDVYHELHLQINEEELREFRLSNDLLCIKQHLGKLSFLFPNLEVLAVHNVDFSSTDFESIATLRHLKVLDIDTCCIENISPITKLQQLETLSLVDTQCASGYDIQPLTELRNLKSLSSGYWTRGVYEVSRNAIDEQKQSPWNLLIFLGVSSNMQTCWIVPFRIRRFYPTIVKAHPLLLTVECANGVLSSLKMVHYFPSYIEIYNYSSSDRAMRTLEYIVKNQKNWHYAEEAIQKIPQLIDSFYLEDIDLAVQFFAVMMSKFSQTSEVVLPVFDFFEYLLYTERLSNESFFVCVKVSLDLAKQDNAYMPWLSFKIWHSILKVEIFSVQVKKMIFDTAKSEYKSYTKLDPYFKQILLKNMAHTYQSDTDLEQLSAMLLESFAELSEISKRKKSRGLIIYCDMISTLMNMKRSDDSSCDVGKIMLKDNRLPPILKTIVSAQLSQPDFSRSGTLLKRVDSLLKILWPYTKKKRNVDKINYREYFKPVKRELNIMLNEMKNVCRSNCKD